MSPTVPALPTDRKATRGRACRAGRDTYQRGRQRALRGFGHRVAEQCGLAYQTVQHELSDADRDPVRRVADRVRAMFARGATVKQVALYLAEVLDVFEAGVLSDIEPLETKLEREAATDADEDVVQHRFALRRTTTARRAHADFLLRQIAASRDVLAAYRRLDAGQVTPR